LKINKKLADSLWSGEDGRELHAIDYPIYFLEKINKIELLLF